MIDKDELIERILSDEKLKDSRFSDNVYTDLPLLRRGSQIKPPETPHKIKEMKEISYSTEARWKTSAWLMYQQGIFMADYTDNAPYTEDFVKYFVTYNTLSTTQLRGYFTWRTKYRNGGKVDAPIPFLFLYAYELINNIGVESPEDGYNKLLSFSKECADSHKVVSRYVSRWLCDYVAYYGLDTKLFENQPDLEFDTNVMTLMNCNEHDDETVYKALIGLSAYQSEQSKFVKANPEDFHTAAVKFFRNLTDYYKKHRKNSLCERLFGRATEMNYRMFEDAVFYDRNSNRTADVFISEIRSYSCRNGEWRCRKIYGNRGRNGKLGDLLKALECMMRERYEFTYKLQMPDIPKKTIELIKNVLDGIDEEKRRARALEINIDLSALSAIRADADETRDKLLTEEDVAETEEITTESEIAEEQIEVISPENSLLEKSETAFILALLNDGVWSAAAREFGCIPSVLADSVNEKLFEEFGDTVIEFDGDTPILVDDYIDDLRTIIEKGEQK